MTEARLCAASEIRCANLQCQAPLPAVEVWPGHIHIYCDKPECQEAAKNCCSRRYIEADLIPCSVPGCNKFAPAGSYDKRHKWFVCSAGCWFKYRSRLAFGTKLVECGCGCGAHFYSGAKKRHHYFLNRDHAGRFRTEQIMKRYGSFRSLAEEYLNGWAARNYTGKNGTQHVRLHLSVFFEYVNQRGITDVSAIDCRFFDEFLTWGEDTKRRQVAYSPSVLSTFFNWLKNTGRYAKDNPVLPDFHKSKQSAHEPRPFEDPEVELAWELLEKRGNVRTKLEMAIFEETGVRIGELANIRLDDVDAMKQRIFIRLPTKNGRTRVVPFGAKTSKYLAEWLEVRDPNCGHDHLLHNHLKKPCSEQQIRRELQLVMCKDGCAFQGRKHRNEDGFDQWKPHRMRHTLATKLAEGGADVATTMEICGWLTYHALCNYARVNFNAAHQGYIEATARSEQLRRAPKPRRISAAEYLSTRAKAS